MLENRVFGFIGTGNMGGALARAVRRAVDGGHILLANRTPEKAQALAGELGALAVDNSLAAARADYLFLGVKPHMMAGMLASIHDTLAGRQTPCVLVSMAAGLSMAKIRAMAGVDFPIIRINPNTPCAVGEGVVLCCADGVDEAALGVFREAMSGAGLLDFIDENLIDAGSVVCGCGPAFAAMFIEALADGGVACGLPRAKAQAYAAQMLLGTAALALERGGMRAAVLEAVITAYEKTLELGKD